jgi:hypothetical protein
MLNYVQVQNESNLPEIGFLNPFKAIIIIEEKVSIAWQARTSRWLVDSGCLYMMAWGQNCSSWDDSVDVASIEKWDFGDIPDEKFVMTTWHEAEPLSEVFYFAKHLANHQIVKIENLLILHIGQIDKKAELTIMFQKA